MGLHNPLSRFDYEGKAFLFLLGFTNGLAPQVGQRATFYPLRLRLIVAGWRK